MTPLHIVSPLIEAPSWSTPERRVRLKLDSLQPGGSFKIRGIGHLVDHRPDGVDHLVSSSGGNAGVATATAATARGLRCTVVVPTTTPDEAKARIRSLDADVVVAGGVWDEAHAEAMSIVDADPAAMAVHPFDHPLLWDGHASLVDELTEQTGSTGSADTAPDAIVCCVGGGGLLSGVATGLDRNGWTDTRIVAVETHGAASYAAAVDAGEPVQIESIDSIAKSLGARRVADEAFGWSRRLDVRPWQCSDADALAACRRMLDEYRQFVEPACGASIAAVLNECDALEGASDVVVVVCGGTVVQLADLL